MNTVLSRALAFGLGAAVAGCSSEPTAPLADPTEVSWSPCENAVDTPSWVAYQDVDGGWTRVTPSTAGTYAFTIHGRGGVAFYADGSLNVVYATAAELNAASSACAGTRRDVTGSITGWVSIDAIALQMGSSSQEFSGGAAQPTSFTLFDVEGDATVLTAVKRRTTSNMDTTRIIPNSVLIKRGITGADAGALSFSSADAGPALLRTATILNAVGNELLALTSHFAAGATDTRLSYYSTQLDFPSGNSASLYALPGTRLVTGEHQYLLAQLSPLGSSGAVSDVRSAVVSYLDAANQTVTFGPYLNPVSVSGSTRPSATYQIQSGYDKTWSFEVLQAGEQVSVSMTSGYAQTTTGSVTLRVPDLAGVPGFNAAWLPAAGVDSDWLFTASGAPLGGTGSLIASYQLAQQFSAFVP